jgi:hypothetical protein
VATETNTRLIIAHNPSAWVFQGEQWAIQAAAQLRDPTGDALFLGIDGMGANGGGGEPFTLFTAVTVPRSLSD